MEQGELIDPDKADHVGPECPADASIEGADQKGIRLGSRYIDPHDACGHVIVPDRDEGATEARPDDPERACDHDRGNRKVHVELPGLGDEAQPEYLCCRHGDSI